MLARLLTYTVRTLLLLAIIFIDISRNVIYRLSHPVPLEGVKLVTMISMEQEAVPADLPTTYRQALGATRYRRAGTMTGWLNRKHRLLVGTLARRGPA